MYTRTGLTITSGSTISIDTETIQTGNLMNDCFYDSSITGKNICVGQSTTASGVSSDWKSD
jgi:hypothetical protein